MADRQGGRHERLALAVRDNRARVWHGRLPALLALEIGPTSFRRSAEVADTEALVAERQALPDAAFLQQPDALVDAVGCFAVAAERDGSGLLFEWAWTDPHEGDWGEPATWGGFTRLAL